MFEDVGPTPLSGHIVVLVTDYIERVRSINLPLEAPLGRLAISRYHIHVVIGAPVGCNPSEIEGEYVFFVDPRDKSRQLSESHYQIMYEGDTEDETGFIQWAKMCANFFKLMQFNVGMVCVDYADFHAALSCCEGKILRFEQLAYDQHDAVPYHKHTGPDYRVIYGCLCGPIDLSLSHWVDFSDVLESRNPDVVMTKLAMTFGPYFPPVMMLLGEAVAD